MGCMVLADADEGPRYQMKALELSAEEPVDSALWNDDCFNRAPFAERLANMLVGQRNPLTIALSAPWGAGKTYFLKRLKKIYEQKSGVCIYFSAWEDDFTEAPLLSLLAQLRRAFATRTGAALTEGTKKALGAIATQVGMMCVKGLLKKATGIDVSDFGTDDIKTRGEKLLEDYQKSIDLRDELKKALEELSASVFEDTRKPLVVIVDELDRCRPTYAIELLERVKHLFCVPNLVFILGMDKGQFCESIKAIYGSINADVYLHRFVDVEMSLPEGRSNIDFVLSLVHRMGLDEHLYRAKLKSANGNWLEDVFVTLADYMKIPAREIEFAMRRMSLVLFARGRIANEWTYAASIAVIFSMLPDKAVYASLVSGTWKPQDIVNKIFPHFMPDNSEENRGIGRIILYLYQFYYNASGDAAFVKEFDDTLAGFDDSCRARLRGGVFPDFARIAKSEDTAAFFKDVKSRHMGGWANVRKVFKDVDEVLKTMVGYAG